MISACTPTPEAAKLFMNFLLSGRRSWAMWLSGAENIQHRGVYAEGCGALWTGKFMSDLRLVESCGLQFERIFGTRRGLDHWTLLSDGVSNCSLKKVVRHNVGTVHWSSATVKAAKTSAATTRQFYSHSWKPLPWVHSHKIWGGEIPTVTHSSKGWAHREC